MNLIEVLRQVKLGDSVYRRSGGKTYTYSSDNCTLQWLRRQSMTCDVTANDWIIEGQISTNALEPVAAVGAEPLRLKAAAIVAMLRQHFDVLERMMSWCVRCGGSCNCWRRQRTAPTLSGAVWWLTVKKPHRF
ncbi:hypothetical protein [Serratia fonticola]|uniref:hypothetical protein n=1 Tax=Serratia fonticola TaxID=47917 RepID=UPI00301BEFF9